MDFPQVMGIADAVNVNAMTAMKEQPVSARNLMTVVGRGKLCVMDVVNVCATNVLARGDTKD